MIYVVIKRDNVLEKYIPGTQNTVLTIPDGTEVIGRQLCCLDDQIESSLRDGSYISENWDVYFMVKEVHIPASVKKINPTAFMGIPQLESFKASDKCAAAKVVDNVLFSKDGKTLICCPPKKKGTYTIPDGVEVIFENAFDSTELETIILPDGLVTIEDDAFQYGFDLSCVYIPASVKKIGMRILEDSDDVVIKAPVGSYAIRYAEKNGIKYEEI